tara:strand:- start:2412 stop:2633 length:222 start_codon:yes stop_codon:yes gene_type:complete
MSRVYEDSNGNRREHDLRGVYVIHRDGDKVTGHYISRSRGRFHIHKFTNCTLESVVEQAERLIHEPPVYFLTA